MRYRSIRRPQTRCVFISLLYALLPIVAYAQKYPLPVTWPMLEQVAYTAKFVPLLEDSVPVPDFPDTVRNLHKKQIMVSGYVIPMDHSRKIMVLSANPYEHCYLCGKGSPLSVMVMALKDTDRRYEKDQYITFTGTFEVDQETTFGPYYRLFDAEEMMGEVTSNNTLRTEFAEAP